MEIRGILDMIKKEGVFTERMRMEMSSTCPTIWTVIRCYLPEADVRKYQKQQEAEILPRSRQNQKSEDFMSMMSRDSWYKHRKVEVNMTVLSCSITYGRGIITLL